MWKIIQSLVLEITPALVGLVLVYLLLAAIV
jgi:hypothetical protein